MSAPVAQIPASIASQWVAAFGAPDLARMLALVEARVDFTRCG